MKQNWFKSGDPWIWLNAGAVAISLILVFGLLGLIAINGFGIFWPKSVITAKYQEPGGKGKQILGEIHDIETISALRISESGVQIPKHKDTFQRYLLKSTRVGTELPFNRYLKYYLKEIKYPKNIVVVERLSGGIFIGYLKGLKNSEGLKNSGRKSTAISNKKLEKQINKKLDRAWALHKKIKVIEKNKIGRLNYRQEELNLLKLKYQYYKEKDQKKYQTIEKELVDIKIQYSRLQSEIGKLRSKINRDVLLVSNHLRDKTEIPVANITRFYFPNRMSVFQKSGLYLQKFWEFISDDPREANTEGGIFPAIMGTVTIVILMAILVTPLGVIAAIYLREYAKQGLLTRIIRISVNNLAGVPSIVYGVFGLGFFVYFIGGGIDSLFFPERASYKPTFGSPALIWASLTLALLTLPVVIVSTEEGLSRVPRAIREGSLALGATKAETLWRTVLPMASPGIMTGLILAVARAAGEVAPLMLVGVVKYSPSPPIDFNAPFIHFDRTIMHLGFHIYDVGFQSPNAEAAQPLVYATAMILVLVIVILNLTAISIRNRLRERFRSLEN